MEQSIWRLVIVGRIVVKRYDSLRTDLRGKFERMAVGAVSPPDAALVFLVGVLRVMNKQIGIHSDVVTGDPIRIRPSAVQETEGGFVIAQIGDNAIL
jgi:hypothetical protein